jgi:hypothetical protein
LSKPGEPISVNQQNEMAWAPRTAVQITIFAEFDSKSGLRKNRMGCSILKKKMSFLFVMDISSYDIIIIMLAEILKVTNELDLKYPLISTAMG